MKSFPSFKHKKSAPTIITPAWENNLLPSINKPSNSNTGSHIDTAQHVEDLKQGQNNILVAVRSRPLNQRELHISNFDTIRVLDDKIICLLDPSLQFDTNDVLRGNRSKEKQYAFDYVFGQETTNPEVFEKTTKFLIPGILDGFNATVFAYGATGAGKTHTMLGHDKVPGLMSLTMNELFTCIQRHSENKELLVKVSYLEVYNETLRDLLSAEANIADLREDPGKGAILAGATEVITTDANEILSLLKIGNKKRTMEATGANVVSSRSHAVLQVTVEQKEKNQGISEETTVSKLSMIDLAGSERASNTNNRGQRMIEGANINKSLLALGNCITLLSEKAEKGLKNLFIPYRDSKLTRLLKDSLGGNCRTIMIANVSPGVICFEDTLNTLKYANRAKNIKTAVVRNVLSVENHVDQYTNIISGLRQENDKLKQLLMQKDGGSGIVAPQGGDEKLLGFVVNERLIAAIRQHFEDEMRVKQKIFDLEFQNDEIEEKLIMLRNEINLVGDSASKAKMIEHQNTQKKIPRQLDNLRRDYSQLKAKRTVFQSRIQAEKNHESIVYLTSIFKQNEMLMENLEWQHKERMAENEVRLKDKHIHFLENQLGLKRDKSTERIRIKDRSSSIPKASINITPIIPSTLSQSQIQPPMMDLASFDVDEKPQSLMTKNILNNETASFFKELNKLEDDFHTSQPTDRSPSPTKEAAVYLPYINPKPKYKTTSVKITRRVLSPVKRIDDKYQFSNQHNTPGPSTDRAKDLKDQTEIKDLKKRLRDAQTRSLGRIRKVEDYYYKKDEFAIQRTRIFDSTEAKQTALKKKYGYVPHIAKKRGYFADRIERFGSMGDIELRNITSNAIKSLKMNRKGSLDKFRRASKPAAIDVAQSLSNVSTAPYTRETPMIILDLHENSKVL